MNNFRTLWGNIKYSLLAPHKSTFFWFYFGVLVICMGSSGIWLIWIDKFKENYTGGEHILSVLSFVIVLIISSGVDILLKEESNKNGMIIVGLLMLFIGIGSILILFFASENCFFYVLSFILYLISLFAWWVANGDKKLFAEEDLVSIQEKQKEQINSDSKKTSEDELMPE